MGFFSWLFGREKPPETTKVTQVEDTLHLSGTEREAYLDRSYERERNLIEIKNSERMSENQRNEGRHQNAEHGQDAPVTKDRPSEGAKRCPEDTTYEVGQLVRHPKFGLGKVLDTEGHRVMVFFKDAKKDQKKLIDVHVCPMGVAMRLVASDIYTLLRPSKCPRRVYLKQHGVEPAEPGPYDDVIARLGEEHEETCLAALPPAVDVSSGWPKDREGRTRDEIAKGTPVIYHGRLAAAATIGGTLCEIVGEPDFLIASRRGRCIVRDAKMSRRITEDDHPEILLQVGLYGWLVQQVTGHAPAGLQVHAGTGDLVDLPFDGGATAMAAIEEIVAIRKGDNPYSPVGWSKCGGCGYHDTCWKQAEETSDVALVSGVDQNLAIALREVGVNTIADLLKKFTEPQLAAFQKQVGSRMQKVGKRAGSILLMAKAMATGKEIMIAPPRLPDHQNWVMFDLEGMPPQLDETGNIYLWGMQVFGKQPGPYLGVTSGFGVDGDRQGWNKFLDAAEAIFNEHKDIPFVHWHHYERVHLDEYVQRFGDRDDIAARVRANLLDLLPITRDSIALPLSSYSLKVVEKHVGFKRTQKEYGGDWSMAKYIEATELENEAERSKVMDEILVYNEEDLKATWAVLDWLRGKGK